jgi:hypothetical protein
MWQRDTVALDARDRQARVAQVNNPSAFTRVTQRTSHNLWKGARHFFGSYGTYHILAIITGVGLTIAAGVTGAAYGLGLGIDFVLRHLSFRRDRQS